MKEKFRGIIIGIVIGALLTNGIAFAKRIEEPINVVYDDIIIFINDKQFKPTDVNGNEVEPFIYNGTTYVPFRAIAEAFGKRVEWIPGYRSIEIFNKFTDADIVAAKKSIKDFFELFANGKYDEMKTLVGGDYWPEFDYSRGVFGMSEATLTKCEFEQFSWTEENTFIFHCSFDMKASSEAVYSHDITELSIHIEVTKDNGRYLLVDFY